MVVSHPVGGKGRVGPDTHAFKVQEPIFLNMLVWMRVPGDGNCLFYSLLAATGQPLDRNMDLRQTVASYVASDALG
jgi:hypothetical protein